MEYIQDFLSFIGRLLIGGMFLWGAVEKLRHWNATVAYMKTKNVPKLKIVLPISIALRILGGISVVLGWYVHLGALLLLVVAIPSVIMHHSFWKVHGAGQEIEKLIFMKEIGVIGGLLLILALGGGHFGFVG